MASLSSLPNELIINIIEYLRPYNHQEPIIGLNSTCKPLSAFKGSLKAERFVIDQLSTNISKLDVSQEEKEEDLAVPILYSPLQAFRETCSLYNELCKPVIYRNFNLVDYATPSIWQRRLPAVQAYSQHIRTIRLQMDVSFGQTLADALSLCRNATSIAIYHDFYNTAHLEPCLVGCIVDLFENGSLDSLGIYWNRNMEEDIPPYADPADYPEDIDELLGSIALSPKARKAIRNLDLVVSSLDESTYDLIRSELTSLRSLSARRTFWGNIPKIWEFPSARHWSPNPNLTRLQLMNCENAYSAHIPNLVRHFVGLQYLVVSTCGDWEDQIISMPLSKSRYTDPSALCNVRKPLKSFQIEHMEDWELAAMGDIPTEKLIITNTEGQHLGAAFQADRDLFPSLRCLQIESQVLQKDGKIMPVTYSEKAMSILRTVCAARSIELRNDAEGLKSFPRHDKELGLAQDD